jgi:hypothetical protein
VRYLKKKKCVFNFKIHKSKLYFSNFNFIAVFVPAVVFVVVRTGLCGSVEISVRTCVIYLYICTTCTHRSSDCK